MSDITEIIGFLNGVERHMKVCQQPDCHLMQVTTDYVLTLFPKKRGRKR